THVAGELVIENEIKPTCEKDGVYDEVAYCSVCSTEMSRKTVVVAGGHVFDCSAPVAESLPSCNKYGY
ncbi:MAG: hypothetical protein II215_03260, partial [Paludibacteraceae bacterium]|nr:hypothetical protein [Paludibacteraceae bacterium]